MSPEEKSMAVFIQAKVKELRPKLYHVPLVDIVHEFKASLIAQALVTTGGRKGAAAELLKMNTTSFREVAKRYKLIVTGRSCEK